ncbi:MANSC domain-containing protein 1 [Perognathus longimembris pacificus]|uniref:MANSC domain-containing protein 1 n=1 Tax=Perognathus longimembris pacificus TaxID=214514 RepID=UPI002018D164|nr:MANSC domain-containing protein 1 [Perognathus longimembris pacificus]XP_048191214.1 MANSC domain-containing protein 1 [Perognathus longimembris pacificus]
MQLREDCGWTYALVTLSLLTLRLSAGQKCLSQSLEDMVIDIQSSLARGIRGNEPTHVASQEDCLNSCCSTRNIAGDKACNLMIFDARKAAGQPNCYLFFCPQEVSCPLKTAAVGLSTHRVIPDARTSMGAAVRPQELAAEDPSPGRASVTPSTLGPTHPGPTHPSGRGASSQMPETSSHWQQLLQTYPWGPRGPQGRSQGPLPFSAPSPSTPGRATPSQPAVSAPVTPEPPAAPQPSHTPGTPQTPPAPSQSPTAPVSADLPHAVTSAAVVPSTLFLAPGEEVQGTWEAEAPGATSRPVPGPTTLSPAWGHGEARGYPSPPLGGAQQSRGGLPFERWLLLGTLLSGVLLLALGLLLLGRALLQALRTRPYSRLDYLINGIYVGI